MARKGTQTNYTAPTTNFLAGYHGREFQKLTFYNSDRKIFLNYDYTVSPDNTASAFSIAKAGSHVKGIGIELENVGDDLKRAGMTTYVNVLDLIFSKAGFDDDFFKIEADCTVDAECITQTFSKAWCRNNYKSWKAMWELFDRFGIKTGDARCGMHVNLDLSHFGNNFDTQIENVRKLGYIINKHYDLFKIAFNRTGSTRWCPRMNYDMNYWKRNQIEYFPTGHDSCCINFGHVRQGRVEIRLVGGQNNYACFRNTMETVFHLIDRVCKISWSDCDDIVKIFSGCNVHVFDRISTNCFRAGVITETAVNEIRPTVKQERFL